MKYLNCINYRFLRFLLSALHCLMLIQLGAQAVKSQETEKQIAGYKYKQVILNTEIPADGLPIIIGLHWSSSNPDEFEKYLTGFTRPVRLILVQAPYPYKTGFSFFRREPEDYYKLPVDEKMAVLLQEGEKLSKFVEEITELYKPKIKPAIIGASQGGDLSYVIAVRYNQLISLSCPLLATMDERIIKTLQLKNSAPIYVFHGTADPIVKIASAKQHIKSLKKNGFKVKLATYENVGHDIPDAMKTDYIKQISRTLFSAEK